MKYKKRIDERLDREYKESLKYGFNVRFYKDVLFYRKGFHFEYICHEDVSRIHRRVEEVISHTSCCAENMDIQKLIVTLKSGETLTVHVCDGEPRLAERLYEDIKSNWSDVEFGTNNS